MENTYEITRTVKENNTVETLYIVDGKKILVQSIFGTVSYADILREIIKGNAAAQKST